MLNFDQNLLNNEKYKDNSTFFCVLIMLFCMFFIVFNSMHFIVLVDGDSMNSTLTDGDVIFVSKTQEVSRGDIVVFDTDHGKLIKRVIAVAGDTIYSDENGEVFIKKQGDTEFIKLVESYALGNTKGVSQVTVLDNEVYVLGDNRGNSQDSRSFGCVKVSNVNGIVTNGSLKDKKISTTMFSWIFVFTK